MFDGSNKNQETFKKKLSVLQFVLALRSNVYAYLEGNTVSEVADSSEIQ